MMNECNKLSMLCVWKMFKLRNMLYEKEIMVFFNKIYAVFLSHVIFLIKIGAHLYISEEGSFEVTKNGMIVKKFKGGETFGELAILYNTKRFASVQGKYGILCNFSCIHVH